MRRKTQTLAERQRERERERESDRSEREREGERMAQKNYLVEVEKAKEAKDGRPSMGPVYRSLFAKDGFPAPIQGMDSCWDVFRYVSLSPCCLLGKSGKIRTKIKRKKEYFVIFSLFYYNNNNYYYYYFFLVLKLHGTKQTNCFRDEKLTACFS